MNHHARISLTVGFSLGLLLSVLSADTTTAQGVSGGRGLSALQKRHLSGVVSVVLDPDTALSRASVSAHVSTALAAPAAPSHFPAQPRRVFPIRERIGRFGCGAASRNARPCRIDCDLGPGTLRENPHR
jgi:hypothetical protein